MNSFIRIFSKYCFLILFAFLFESVFNKITQRIVYNLIENILFAVVLITPLCFLKNKRLNKYYYIISFLLFAICIYFETVYYYLFKTPFSSSAIFVTLDSNIKEANEFISFYSDIRILFFTLLFLMISFIVLLKYKLVNIIDFGRSKTNSLKIVSSLIVILIFLKLSGLIGFNFPYLLIKSTKEYYVESKKLGNYEENKNGNFTNVLRESNDEDELYVIIIGESTSRGHLGIYGYYRETTPLLNQRKQELLIHKDVISPHAYSVGSLTKILTLGNYENPKRITEGSIIQLINSAGFETYWLSNQRPIGTYESMITKISLSAKRHKFLTTTIAGNSKVLDEKLIYEFDEVLKNKAKKRVVFIHLMGTHHHYKNRYPDTFNKFNDTPISNFITEESFVKINHYDNAVLYNDFLISEVIRKADSLNNKSFVLYFSDHGEEMFDDLNMAGHNEDIYSKKMFDIPFLLWQSEEYKQKKTLFFVKDRQYMIDDLFHSVADLIDISALEVDYTRSLFSNSFKERKRIIKDTIDYDLFFKR